jgi:hypothetical protein
MTSETRTRPVTMTGDERLADDLERAYSDVWETAVCVGDSFREQTLAFLAKARELLAPKLPTVRRSRGLSSRYSKTPVPITRSARNTTLPAPFTRFSAPRRVGSRATGRCARQLTVRSQVCSMTSRPNCARNSMATVTGGETR